MDEARCRLKPVRHYILPWVMWGNLSFNAPSCTMRSSFDVLSDLRSLWRTTGWHDIKACRLGQVPVSFPRFQQKPSKDTHFDLLKPGTCLFFFFIFSSFLLLPKEHASRCIGYYKLSQELIVSVCMVLCDGLGVFPLFAQCWDPARLWPG